MHFSWQIQDAANLIVSDFVKASRNLQFLDLPGAFFVAGARRSQTKASHNLQFLDLQDAFCVAGAGQSTLWSFFVAAV